MLLAKVKKTIEKYRMLVPGDRVVVAVSGGPDSVCLLSVLQALAKDLDLALHVAHLDHMFRGEESAAEARFVAGLAEKYGIPAAVERLDVPFYCLQHGLSSQAGARKVRYDFLNRVLEKTGAQRIALGHTASDQAETLVMRLLRGAGLSALAGIPPVRERIIRPLINCTRDEVLEYLRGQGLSFVTDSSNLKSVYTRNKVRQEIMPILKNFNPRIEETLATEAGLLRDEDEAMDASLAAILSIVFLREGETVRLNRDGFNAQLPSIRRRLLRTALAALPEADVPELSAVQTEEALAFMAEAQTGRAMDLPGGLSLEREYDGFILRLKALPEKFLTRLTVPGVTAVPEFSLEVVTQIIDILTLPFEFPSPQGSGDGDKEKGLFEENNLWQAAFDYDKIAPPLFIRSRRDGDRFCPAGMGGKSKKLQDYFTDEKVPLRKRDTVPILATEQDVVWVVGMRTDERFLAGAGTKRVLVMTVKT